MEGKLITKNQNSTKIKIGVELSGLQASDRARGHYIVSELRALGYDANTVQSEDSVDVRIMLKRDYLRVRNPREILIFDVSDAILNPPLTNSLIRRIYQRWVINPRIKRFLFSCDAVVVACEAQRKEMVSCQKSVYVIPDASFYHKLYEVKQQAQKRSSLVYVWDGQAGNFNFIKRIIEENASFFRKDGVVVKIITDKVDPLTGRIIPECIDQLGVNSIFVEWNQDTFIQEVANSDIGLAPIDIKCPHAKAKPENKIVNYLGLGLPVIASATKAYSDLEKKCQAGIKTCTNSNDWLAALSYWEQNKKKKESVGLEGRKFILNNFDPSVLVTKWEKVILDAARNY